MHVLYSFGQLQLPVCTVRGLCTLGNWKGLPPIYSICHHINDIIILQCKIRGYSKVTWTVPLTDRCTVGPLRGQLLGEQVQGEGRGGEGGQQVSER